MSEMEKDEEKSKDDGIENRRKTSRRASKRKSTSKRRSTSRRQSRRQSRRKSSKSSRRSLSKKSKRPTAERFSPEDIEAFLRESDQFLESPIDLRREDIQEVDIQQLQWTNYHSNPIYLKMTNTTRTIVVNGLYPEMYTPTLTGGPLAVPYKFSQLHFHWGAVDGLGSEHRIQGESYPLEGHMVMYKSTYERFEQARSHEDGVIVLVYMYQIHDKSDLTGLTKYLSKVKHPYSQIPITTVSLESFFPQLVDDYVMYFGKMAGSCLHGVVWLVSRKTLGITEEEMEDFRNIEASTEIPVSNNFRDVKPLYDRNVYMVNATDQDKKLVLHPLPRLIKSRGKSPGSSRKSRAGKSSRRASKRQSKTGKRQSRTGRRQSKRASRKK